jgi:L-aspartate oxidase
MPSTLPSVPRRLASPEPGWAETTDVVVVGSGVAGLTCALHLREAGLHVTVVTKVNIDDGSTRWAQGGIAAVLDPFDSPAAHAADTLAAGVGLCDVAAVKVLVTEGPARVRELIRWGTHFDRHADGSLMLTREGGHHANRIVHAGGDATGAEVQRALHTAVRRDPWIRLIEHALVLDLLRDRAGHAYGVTLHVLGEGTEDGVGAIHARAVVLATGGMGQVFAATTNPVVSTGDGVALALRAGAVVADVEFVQFHPTSLYLGGAGAGAGSGSVAGPAGPAASQQPLISEALRGEGAHLVDGDHKRFMVGQHDLAELAPRDVVAKAIHRVMLSAGTDHVFLDARHVADLATRFPTITASCLAAGIDPTQELIPVTPAAHYASGGVRTDLHGRTSIPGLYACGEVACTGVHGANRLASNSLLEGLVFARRIARDVAAGLDDRLGSRAATAGVVESMPDVAGPYPGLATLAASQDGLLVDSAVRGPIQAAMTLGAGVLRSGRSLAVAAAELVRLGGRRGVAGTRTWEATNLFTVASALVCAARRREETRGCHWREDFPQTRSDWSGHLLLGLDGQGSLADTWEPHHEQPA